MGLIAAEGGDLWPVALYAGCRPYHRALKLEGLQGASRLLPPSRPVACRTAAAKARSNDDQKRGGGRRGTRAARKKAAASAPANKDARAGTTKAADDGTPATLPPHERDTAGGLAAALATAERDSTTRIRIAASEFAAPPTREPTVETMNARPKRETRPTGTKTPIAGREARMHERKTLAGQGGHAPPGTSTALKRRLYLGRPEKGAAAEWETRLGRWKQRQSAVAPAASADDKPAAQKPVAPAASAERRGGRHSSATAAGCARKGRGAAKASSPHERATLFQGGDERERL